MSTDFLVFLANTSSTLLDMTRTVLPLWFVLLYCSKLAGELHTFKDYVIRAVFQGVLMTLLAALFTAAGIGPAYTMPTYIE